MPIALHMPALSPTMTEGNLARWMIEQGTAVSSGTLLAEIETDKAVMEFEAIEEGVLGRIDVPAGAENVAVGTVIGWLLEEGEDASAIPVSQGAPGTPVSMPMPATPDTSTPTTASAVPSKQGRIFASPLAKRLAKTAGIDLSMVQGSGPHGRIVKRDVESFTPTPASAPVSSPPPSPSPVGAVGAAGAVGADTSLASAYRLEKPSTMRRIIAQRLQESKQNVPHFYLTVDIELDALLAARKQINALQSDVKVSVNDFVIKCVAAALDQVPAANASWTDEGVRYYERADVAVAVAIPGGLITPVVRNAANKRIAEISSEMKSLAMKARDGKLTPEEYSNGTFSISNLGMYGIREFAAVINPPQACILAVGAGEQRAVVRDGQITIATIMSVTISTDHRAVDGAVAAEWLTAFKRLIENPVALL